MPDLQVLARNVLAVREHCATESVQGWLKSYPNTVILPAFTHYQKALDLLIRAGYGNFQEQHGNQEKHEQDVKEDE